MRLMVLHGSTMGQGLAPELEEQEGAWMEVRAAVSHRPDGTAPDPARPRRQRRKGMILKRASRRINVQHPKSIRMSLSRFLSFETLPPMPREDRVDLSAGTILLIKQRNRPASYEVILAQGSPPYRLFPRPLPRSCLRVKTCTNRPPSRLSLLPRRPLHFPAAAGPATAVAVPAPVRLAVPLPSLRPRAYLAQQQGAGGIWKWSLSKRANAHPEDRGPGRRELLRLLRLLWELLPGRVVGLESVRVRG